MTNVGNGIGFDAPHFRIPRTYQYSFGFQHELPRAILVEVSYAGNYQVHINTSFNSGRWSFADNEMALAPTSTACPTCGRSWGDLSLPNPFFGIIPRRGVGNNATIARRDLLRPDPIFPDITNFLVQDGHYRSDALQVKIEQRVLGGRTSGILTWGISYTLSKAFEANHRLNNWNANEPLINELDNTDKPQTFAFHGVYDLPVGKDRWLFKDRVSNAIAGNWRFDWIFTYSSGYPVNYPDLVLVNSPSCSNSTWYAAVQNEDSWFNNDKNCYRTRASDYERRTLPDRFPNLRNPTKPQLNVALEKTFNFGERYKFQLRGEAFNVTNTPIRPGPNTDFGSSDFGKLPKTQNNWPRVLQVAGKIYF
jgi:hypothetical protein